MAAFPATALTFGSLIENRSATGALSRPGRPILHLTCV
jgi:hypothetical protein